jgi:hypothetical protein
MILKAILVLAALQQPAAQNPAGPHRPRDPFVFRSVLDQRPRMITIALADDMWVAYDTTTCGLYKAWKGGVKLDGAVYTTVHGPQPTSQGSSYLEGIDEPLWDAHDKSGKPIECTSRYAGYRLEQGAVLLEWEILLADGRKVAVDERPEFVRPEDVLDETFIEENALHKGYPGLLRTYSAPEIPDDVMVGVLVKTSRNSGRLCESCDRESMEDKSDVLGSYTEVRSHVEVFPLHRATNFIVFFAPKADEPKKSEKKDGGQSEAKPK